MDWLAGALGKQGERGVHHAGLARRDDGYFGPGSVSWRVWGHPQIGVAGIRGALIALLDPAGAAGVAQHGVYRKDPLGRVRRSNAFFLATVFGDTEMAEKAGTWLFRRHASINGVVPSTGDSYRANTPETMLFVFVTGWHGTLECYQKYGGRKLSNREIREFYAESVVTAELCGLPARLVPRTPEQVEEYLEHAATSIMAMTDDAQEVFDFFLHPPLSPRWPMVPVNPFLRIAARAAIATFPKDVRELAGLPATPIRDAIYPPTVRLAANAMTLPILDDLMVIAGGEAWGVRHNATRHSPGTGRQEMQFSRAAELQGGPIDTSPPEDNLMPAWHVRQAH